MTIRIFALIPLFLLLMKAGDSVDAHEVRPGYLEIRQRSAETYDVLWKVPALGDLRLRLEVRYPEQCSLVGPPVTIQSGDAFLDRRTIRCPGGLEGRSISVDGLLDSMTDVLVRREPPDGTTHDTRLTPAAQSLSL
jgi:hypothetical protein